MRTDTTVHATGMGDFVVKGGDQAATAATLLLATIGLGGLFLARHSASAMSTSLLFPVRVLAALPVVFSVAGAAIIIGHFPVAATRIALICACAGTAVVAFFLGWLWWRTSRAAEGRQES